MDTRDIFISMQTGIFDIRSLLGLSGVPFVESIVNYLKYQWRLSPRMAPLAAHLVGLIWNIGIGALYGVDIRSGIIAGLLTGFGASVWYEATKEVTVVEKVIKE